MACWAKENGQVWLRGFRLYEEDLHRSCTLIPSCVLALRTLGSGLRKCRLGAQVRSTRHDTMCLATVKDCLEIRRAVTSRSSLACLAACNVLSLCSLLSNCVSLSSACYTRVCSRSVGYCGCAESADGACRADRPGKALEAGALESRTLFERMHGHPWKSYCSDVVLACREIIQKFFSLVEGCDHPVAVHCKAGLGRTGTLIGCYAIKNYK